MCRIPVKTLRYYADEGLLVPDEIDRFTGYRYYAPSKLAVCSRILVLKELGFALDDIRTALNSDRDIRALIGERRAELKAQLEKTQRQLDMLDSLSDRLKEGDEKMLDTVIRREGGIRIACVRRIFETREDARSLIADIRASLPERTVGSRSVIINYDTELCESGFDFAVGVEVNGTVGGDYDIRTLDFEGECASVVCREDELADAYAALTRGIGERDCRIIGAYAEIYHADGTAEVKVPVVRLQSDEVVSDDEPMPPFENDTEAVGRWVFIDKVPSYEQFSPDKVKYSGEFFMRELYFLSGGEGYWIIKGWTKGIFDTQSGCPSDGERHGYTIKNVKNRTLMFVTMFTDRRAHRHGGLPEICVFEKADGIARKPSDIRIRDNTDLPYICDPSVHGEWHSVDCVRSIERFDPLKPRKTADALFWRSVRFDEGGGAEVSYRDGRVRTLNHTRGILLDREASVTEAYEMRMVGESEYLFIQWKSGDYIYAGREPVWYVFRRA